MQFKPLFLVGFLATLSLGRVTTSPRHDQEENFQLSKRLGAVLVDINTVGTAQNYQKVWTQGLDTCSAILAVGTPSANGGVAKVMAHISSGNTQVVQDWPDPSRNANPDPAFVQAMAIQMGEDYDYIYNLLATSGPGMSDFNTFVKDQAHGLMTAGMTIYQRNPADIATAKGFGQMESSVAGAVVADTHTM